MFTKTIKETLCVITEQIVFSEIIERLRITFYNTAIQVAFYFWEFVQTSTPKHDVTEKINK